MGFARFSSKIVNHRASYCVETSLACIHEQLAAIREQTRDIHLSKNTRKVLDYLLDSAEQSGRLSVSPTNARIMQAAGCCRRTVQYAFETLTKLGIGVRTPGSGCERPSLKRRRLKIRHFDPTPGVWTFTAPETVVSSRCEICTPYRYKGSYSSKSSLFAPVAPFAPTEYPEPPPDEYVFDPDAYPEVCARARACKRAAPRCPRPYTPVAAISEQEAIAWADSVLSGAIPPPVEVYPARVGEYGYGERWVQFEEALARYEATYTPSFPGGVACLPISSNTAARVGHKPKARRRRAGTGM